MRSVLSLSIVLLLATGVLGNAARAEEAAKRLAMHDAPRPLPDLSFEDTGGAKRHLADFKGRVVLLNLWATWCIPCRHEMPTLDRLQESLGGAEFEVVALSIDRAGAKVVEPFFQQIGLKHLAIYIDRTGAAARAVAAVGIPITLLIDRSGAEVGRAAGALEWDSPEIVNQIRHLLAGSPKNQQVIKGDRS